MTWFRGLEGIRAWLALAVLIEHVVGLTDLPDHRPVARHLVHAGDSAVSVFIVISGFVITHMILARHEPYPLYLARRLLRIYPVYAVCLALGVSTTLLLNRLMPLQPWGLAIPFTHDMARACDGLAGSGLLLNLGLHLSLLHGLVPDNLLFRSQLALLTPAWSLSLEWQFYLLAPLLVLALRRPDSTLLVTATALALYLLTRRNLPGSYLMPSLLPASALPFALGIATRLILPGMALRRSLPLALMLLIAVAMHTLAPGQGYLVAWAILVLYMTTELPADPLGRMAYRLLHAGLDSPLALWAGRRSYCIYMLHFPVLQLLLWSAGRAHLGYGMTVATLAIAGLPLTLLGADLLHRHVEQPGIALGRSLGRFWPQPGAGSAVDRIAARELRQPRHLIVG